MEGDRRPRYSNKSSRPNPQFCPTFFFSFVKFWRKSKWWPLLEWWSHMQMTLHILSWSNEAACKRHCIYSVGARAHAIGAGPIRLSHDSWPHHGGKEVSRLGPAIWYPPGLLARWHLPRALSCVGQLPKIVDRPNSKKPLSLHWWMPLIHKSHIECTSPSRSQIQYICSLPLSK